MLYQQTNRGLRSAAEEGRSDAVDWADVIRFANLAKWPVVICAVLFAVAAFVYTLVAQPLYTASASIVLQNQKGLVISKEANGSIPMDVGEIETQMEMIKSERVTDEVIRTTDVDRLLTSVKQDQTRSLRQLLTSWIGFLGAQTDDHFEEEASELARKRNLVRQGLSVNRPGLSYAIQVNYVAREPEAAAVLANAYVQAYIAERHNQRRDAVKVATAWMEERVSQLRTQAEQAYTAAEEYREANIGVRPGTTADPSGETADQRRVKLKRLENAAQTLQSTYETFFQRLAELTQQQSAPGSDAVVLNTAEAPSAPSFPKKKLTLALALIAGAAAGIAGALIRHLISKLFVSPQYLQAAGLPYLGSIPAVSWAQKHASQDGLRRFLQRLGLGPRAKEYARSQSKSGGERAILESADSPFSTAILNIKVELDLAGLGRNIHTLGVVSTGPSDAASVVVSNLALLEALQGSALLVDAEGRNSQLFQALARPGSLGVVDAITRGGELSAALQQDNETGLYFLPYNAQPGLNLPIAAVPSRQLSRLFEAARAQAEVTIVHVPPIASAATKSLLPYLDALLILAETGQTGTRLLMDVVKEIETRGGNVMGVALYEGTGQDDQGQSWLHVPLLRKLRTLSASVS
ncbi:Wzz/FepE/Etk N-terminal domain-containing protein [Microvirga terrae]|uniref:Wzz/FepE/Etk N-terminal domain-containing protein n=1 Tax=Microvirga terrae TaxID=2740529 RepID=A0ABY5RQ09_9HYPH|nr:Wzz/FepE/Etk N-terminal domain-containing protein [Microvirga terrae]UVF18411.1 Wzz/FepE/Etk N-terminal domain-containing protein [Microvirga terrae]